MIEYLGYKTGMFRGTLTGRMQQIFEWEAKRLGKTMGSVLWQALRNDMHRIEEVQIAEAEAQKADMGAGI